MDQVYALWHNLRHPLLLHRPFAKRSFSNVPGVQPYLGATVLSTGMLLYSLSFKSFLTSKDADNVGI